jgi:nascent polypeptide-associated complex subunit alpha
VANREPKIPKEDIALIVEQTGVSEKDAMKALEDTDGDIAEAIMKLSSE